MLLQLPLLLSLVQRSWPAAPILRPDESAAPTPDQLSRYGSLYADLQGLPYAALGDHWHKHGQTEGRVMFWKGDETHGATTIRKHMAIKYILNASGCEKGACGAAGLEIGALAAPWPLPQEVPVKYVDFADNIGLSARIPEVPASKMVHVDIVDSGEKLEKVDDGSVSFILTSHFLEHTQNLLGTLLTHCKRLRPNGVLVFEIPNKDFTFDVQRQITPYEHFLEDEKDGGKGSFHSHVVDFIQHAHQGYTKQDLDKTAEQLAQEWEARGTGGDHIHFHVWDEKQFKMFAPRWAEHLTQKGCGMKLEEVTGPSDFPPPQNEVKDLWLVLRRM